ncbi:hypothetical protein B0H14DRAFT_2494751 [Mycena olivaceomarginata]|nr:hypothetical protein B0H14DRAFT_2494751 [Mycena olivaceomarginata]
MKAAVKKAFNMPTRAKKEEILKTNGLHGITVPLLWGYRFSDSYAAYSYDTLHSDDLGKWGHHLWKLLSDVLEEIGNGQSFYDILKSIIEDYEHHCSRVSVTYGKDFNFFKQHATSHIIQDILDKGTTDHGSTRPGEGFHQEAAEAYNRTNFKDMDRIDETQEAIARIRMAIDNYDKQRAEDKQEEDIEFDETPNASQFGSASWRFGAPERLFNSRSLEEFLKSVGFAVPNFDLMLRDFIAENFPGDCVAYEERIQIRPFKCAHITYQSLEDWRGLRDIVRCNPSFHGYSRHDSVLVNCNSPGLSFARLCALFRCALENKRQIDVALVHEFKLSKWKPRTRWAGYQAHEEMKDYSLLLMDYMVRGALLTPVAEKGRGNLHFLVDTIDSDMFLRADKY